MRKSVRPLMILVALGVLFGCATVSLGQERIPNVGSSEKATDDPEVVEAAEFAVSAQKQKEGGPLSLVSIKRANAMSTRDTAYLLCLEVKAADEDDSGVETQSVEVTVSSPPTRGGAKKWKLGRWQEKNCGGGDSERHHGPAKLPRPDKGSAALTGTRTPSPDVPEILGVVTRSGSGKKLAGVKITFDVTGGDKVVRLSSTTSRSDGTYYIRDEAFLGFGQTPILVTARLNGYAEWSQTVQLDESPLTVNIQLTPAAQ